MLNVVCRSPLFSEMLVTSFSEHGYEVGTVVSSPRDLQDVDAGDVILIHVTEVCKAVDATVGYLKSLEPTARVLILCANNSVDRVRDEVGDLAEAIIPDDVHVELLTGCVEMLNKGYRIVHNEDAGVSARKSAGDGTAAEPGHHTRAAAALSKQEEAVLERLRGGSSNKVIANSLGISEATVKVHLRSIYRKAGVKNRTQAALWSSSHV